MKSAIDFFYAYANATLYIETTKVTRFSSGDQFFIIVKGLYVHKDLRNPSTQQMSLFFKK